MSPAAFVEEFLRVRDHLSLIHQVPGRMRLRLGVGLFARAAELSQGGLQGALQGLPGIRAVRLNLAAASLVIEYDPKLMTPDAWVLVLEGNEDEARDILSDWLA